MSTLVWLAAILILAEALNKLERTNIRGFWTLSWRQRVELLLKLAAWGSMAIGAMGVVVHPVVALPWPDVADGLVVVGVALLLLRTRVTEALFRDARAKAVDEHGNVRRA